MSGSGVNVVESASGVAWLESALLRDLGSTYHHFFSLRRGGMSTGRYQGLNLGLRVEDDTQTVLRNRLLLFGSLDLVLSRAAFCEQVQQARVRVVGPVDAGSGAWVSKTALPQCDALITRDPDICLTVLLADCVPVLAIDPVLTAVGIAHAGWRGSVAGVTSAMISRMSTVFGTRPHDIRAAIGPSISPSRYEVGPEVVKQAAARFDEKIDDIVDKRDTKLFFDLWRANQIELQRAGVPPEHISTFRIATDDPANELYSERAEGRPCGRFAAGIVISSSTV